MTADDLSTPVHRKTTSILHLIRVRMTPPRLAIAVLVLLAAGLVGWLTLAGNPLGGEPVVVISLDKPTPGNGTANDGKAGPGDMRESVSADDKGTEVEGARNGGAIAANKNATDDHIDEPLDRLRSAHPLVRAPVRAVSQRGKNGLLPMIAKDGRRPADVYARPLRFTPGAANAKGRIAILIGGMGLSTVGTAEAIAKLPEEVTLAYAPYAKSLQRWIAKSRRLGHEVMLQVPMEPFDFPDNDPGPYTLLTDLSEADNLRRLEWLLSRFSGYTGVVNYMGAKFTSSTAPLQAILRQLKKRGLLLLDDGSSPRTRAKTAAQSIGLDAAVGDVVIDVIQSEDAIDDALKRLEVLALKNGQVIGTGSGLPVTVDRISEWARDLKEKDIVLVPVSALIKLRNTK